MRHAFRMLYVLPLLLVLASCLNKQSSIQEIDSLEQASAILDTADKSTLVVFNIEDTLTYPTDTIMQSWFERSPRGEQIFKELEEHTVTKADPQAYTDMILSKMHFAQELRTVELETKPIVQKLQSQRVKVIAITNGSAGAVGIIPSMQAWRFEALAHAGINFSASFEQQEIALNKITTPERCPLFYKGILMADFVGAGTALMAFLDAVGYKPDKIIFFDDQEKNVEEVKIAAKARGIAYHGFIYRAAEKLPRQYDPAIIDLQSEYLIEHDEYITEERARELLKKSKKCAD